MPAVRAIFAFSALIVSSGSLGQDMMRHVDLASPEMTQAEVTRADVEILIQNGAPVDLSNRRLSGLDLSGLNLKAANLRASRLRACLRRRFPWARLRDSSAVGLIRGTDGWHAGGEVGAPMRPT